MATPIVPSSAVNLCGRLEAASVVSWPAREIVDLGGWALRFGGGFTRRVNSVAALAFDGGDLDARIDQAEAEYARRGLVAQFQVSPASQPSSVAERLAARGYRAQADTSVWTGTPQHVRSRLPPPGEARGTERPDDEWAAVVMSGARSEGEGRERLEIVGRVPAPLICVSARSEGKTVAVGTGAFRAGWVGINVMRTASDHRRRGHAQRVLAAITEWALASGATLLYLSVERDNEAACALYARAGFEPAYEYRYWCRR